jgi:hypothetical protein
VIDGYRAALEYDVMIRPAAPESAGLGAFVIGRCLMVRYAPAIALATLLLPSIATAHHGWSSYDETKPVTLTAPLTAVSWSNPHGTARVTWQKKQWDVVLAPVTRMEARGLTEAMLTTGKPVTLIGYPRRDGTAEVRIERVTIGGKTIELR